MVSGPIGVLFIVQGTRNVAATRRATGKSRYFGEECEDISTAPGCRASKRTAARRLARHFNPADCEESVEEEETSTETAAASRTVERKACVLTNLEGKVGTFISNVEEETESRYFGHVVLNLSEDSSSGAEDSHKRGKQPRKRKKARGRQSVGKAKTRNTELQETRKALPWERSKRDDVVGAGRNGKDASLKENVDVHEEESDGVRGRSAITEVSAMVLCHERNVEDLERCFVAVGEECQAVDDAVQSTERSMTKEMQPACPSDSDVDWEEVDGKYCLNDGTLCCGLAYCLH